jgi:hypothetical protein
LFAFAFAVDLVVGLSSWSPFERLLCFVYLPGTQSAKGWHATRNGGVTTYIPNTASNTLPQPPKKAVASLLPV